MEGNSTRPATDVPRFLLLPISADLAKLRSRSFARSADIWAAIMRRPESYAITPHATIMRRPGFYAITPKAKIIRQRNMDRIAL